MEKTGNKISEYLLQIKAIKLEPAKPFTWASGWKSPIYCDNRKTLSYPAVRDFIKREFVRIIKAKYPETEIIAGVATGAIAHAALVAQELNLPLVYVRPNPKQHGLENLIEGVINPGQRAVVVEDLISTGKSSLKAVEALEKAGAHVEGMVAIFTYGFPVAEENFKNSGCELTTLGNYNVLVDLALKSGYIKEKDVNTLRKWREDPGKWRGDE
ncbi:MAG: orotate phosphoribosyltransferase [Bacteroidales bacterium]|nr:MAG: orotate phosphoribosyltransferase [Bacteroidales bacterium]